MINTTYRAVGSSVVRCERNGMLVEQTIAVAATKAEAQLIANALNATQEMREESL